MNDTSIKTRLNNNNNNKRCIQSDCKTNENQKILLYKVQPFSANNNNAL